jgi:thymidine kinase
VHHEPRDTGWIEVICGSMFSGKTEELIRRLRRAAIARQRVQVFKPVIDDRYDIEKIASHTGQTCESRPILDIEQVDELLHRDTRVVGLDEAQFFSEKLVPMCESLANRGLRVIVATLDQDFRGEPFPAVPRLLCISEYVTKMQAICVVCGNPANRSQRLSGGSSQVQVGGTDYYEARCRACFRPQVIEQGNLTETGRNGRKGG